LDKIVRYTCYVCDIKYDCKPKTFPPMWLVDLYHEGAPRWFCSDYCKFKSEKDNMIKLNEVYVNCIEEEVVPIEFITLKIDGICHNGVIYEKFKRDVFNWKTCCKLREFQYKFKLKEE